MSLLEGIAAGVGHIEHVFVEPHALRLPAHLAGADNGFRLHVDLGHIAFGERGGATFVGIRSDIKILSVGTETAVVGHALRGPAGRAIGVDKLDDVAPVDGNGDQRVVDLDNIIGGITELRLVDMTKPLVGQRICLAVIICQLSVVTLPVAFIANDQILFCLG